MGILVVVVLGAALAFALLWAVGANDVANALGTSVGSKAVTVRQAVLIGAVFECLGSSLMGSHVANTLSNELVDHDKFDSDDEFAVGMFAALLSSFVWITIGTYFSLPLSSTHTIVGSVMGFAVLGAGWDSVRWSWLQGIVASWFLSPLLGGLVANLLLRFLRAFVLPQDGNDLSRVRTFTPWLLALTVSTNVMFVLVGGPSLTRVDLAWYYLIPLFFGMWVVGYPVCRVFMQRWEQSQEIGKERSLEEVKAGGGGGGENEGSSNPQEDPGDTEKELRVAGEADPGQSEPEPAEPEPEPEAVDPSELFFVPLMVVTGCTVAFAHGGNDVANAIGPFFVILEVHANGEIPEDEGLPLYLPLIGGVAIALGLGMWGYRVMRTVGNKITKLTFSKGYCAQFGAGLSVLLATSLGLPISTTSVIVGSVMGVGLVDGRNAVNLKTIRDIVSGWVITLPIAAVVAMAVFAAFREIVL